MKARPDMSEYLIHFTKGETFADAFGRFQTILSECRLVGGSGMICGEHRCVCFSEAPLPLPNGLVNKGFYSKYSPYGILFEKQWVFEQGGRPVIYQPRGEYDLLPDAMKWRHVTYEPPMVDFTWEREWRICCPELSFDPGVASLVVPSEADLEALVADHDAEQEAYWYEYSTVMAEDELRQFRQDFPWRIISLSE